MDKERIRKLNELQYRLGSLQGHLERKHRYTIYGISLEGVRSRPNSD